MDRRLVKPLLAIYCYCGSNARYAARNGSVQQQRQSPSERNPGVFPLKISSLIPSNNERQAPQPGGHPYLFMIPLPDCFHFPWIIHGPALPEKGHLQ